MIKNARINIQELQDAKLLMEILVKTLLDMLYTTFQTNRNKNYIEKSLIYSHQEAFS